MNQTKIIENIGFDKAFFDLWAIEVLTTVRASNIRRIHNEGKSVSGSPIGKYSTHPIYINPSKSPVNFTPKTRNKKNPKTKYFPGGYKQFRESIGRKTDVVNLQLTGQLEADFIIEAEGQNWALGFNSPRGEKLHHGLEKHFGKEIWGLTKEDERIIDEITDRFLKQYA